MSFVSVEKLREVFSFDPETGRFIWNCPERPSYHGKEAGYIHPKGYRILRVGGIGVRAHRAAWAIVHGEYPAGDIDHMNRDRADNRIVNLRLATGLQNARNRGVRRDSSSGVKGVTWHKGKKLWRARIVVEGKRLSLGEFSCKDRAAEAYVLASVKYFGEFSPI